MFWTKKRKPCMVIVRHTDHDGKVLTSTIEIPMGYRYIIGIMCDELLNPNGEVVKSYDWIAGYTHEYQWFY